MARARVEITATNNIQKGLNASKKQLSGYQQYVVQMGEKIRKAFSITAIATAAVAGIKTITNACKQCVSAFSEAEKVSSRITAVWENVGTATGKTAKQMDDYAESMEKVTYFSSESIKEAGLLLAATESLTEDGFDRALQASMDLAAALGEDVASAAQTLSKAIQEPESALSRLKTIGVSFTEDEKAQIKALTDANKQYEAQALILDKVEQRYKGVAQAINNTPVGTLDNIKDTLDDIRESLGGALLDAISPALQNIYEWLQRLSDWISSVTDFNKIFNSLNRGESIANYSSLLLEQTRDYYKELVANPPNNEIRAHLDKYLSFIDTLDAELQRRSQLAQTTSNTVTPIVIGGGTATSSSDVFADFLKANTPKDLVAEYTSVVETAQSYLDKFTQAVPTSKAELISLLGLDANASGADIKNAISEGGYIPTLQAIIETFTGKLNALTAIPELLDSPTLTDLDSILDKYGKDSVSYQKEKLKEEYNKIAAVYEYASEEQKVYLKEILAENEAQRAALEEIQSSFLDKLGDELAKLVPASWGTSEQASAGISKVLSNATESFGEAGELISELAQNMATMGPVIGAIVTALKYVIEGLAETIGPMLEDVVTYGLEPLREIGRVIGDLIKPLLEELMPLFKDSAESFISVINEIGAALKPVISLIATAIRPILDQLRNTLKFIEPVIKVISKVLVSFTGVIEYIGQVLTHWVATFLNWLAGLNLFGWKPFEGLRITDPGAPGNFSEFMDKRYSSIESAGESATMGTSSQLAVSSASYRGATSVTINIYQEGPLVGDGGMRQFAEMIREEFDALNYYGVSA